MIHMACKNLGVISVVASCQACEWHDEDYNHAKDMAREHSKVTGHFVSVEVTKSYEYQGREAP